MLLILVKVSVKVACQSSTHYIGQMREHTAITTIYQERGVQRFSINTECLDSKLCNCHRLEHAVSEEQLLSYACALTA